ncbi:MAG: copper resistance protein CopC [Paraburkholderia sp.]|nr:MAG: copper resistance protein CopC [Paraburkholderia sp.]
MLLDLLTDHRPIVRTLLQNTRWVRGLAAALLLTAAQLAHAHAYPTHQTPLAGATVNASQREVVIDFDDRLEPAFSAIAVTDSHGKSITDGKAVVDAANKKRMSVALGELMPGVYTVAWTAVSADGHRTQGRYAFTVK